MDEIKLGQIYSKIAQIVVDMIPQEWDRVYLYGEITEDVYSAFFYYQPSGQDAPVYFYKIHELFGMKKSEFMDALRQLTDALKVLWEEFRNQGQEQWTNLTMIFDSEGDFKIDYDYEDLSEADDLKRKVIWKYTHLGLVPENKFDKAFLEQYLKNKKS